MLTETLEERQMFSSYLAPNGYLSISGSDNGDVIWVRDAYGLVRVDEYVIGQTPPAAKFYQSNKVAQLHISGLGGSDWISNETTKSSIIYAGDGNDTVIGGSSYDYIYAEAGNDSVYGNAGNDYIDTGVGTWGWVFGGDGNDTMYTGWGNDTMYGGAGNDFMRSYDGVDYLFGGDGNDSLQGGDKTDYLYGQNGVDSLWGENGNDRLDGGADNNPDAYIGGAGNDTFVTHWIYSGGSWQNYSRAYDYMSWGANIDYWVNP